METNASVLPKIGCILMAAGSSTRFGQENKLFAHVNGKPLIAHALEVVPQTEFSKLVLVTQYAHIGEMGAASGFLVCMNDAPEKGLSHTIHLGMDAMPTDTEAILFLVADQPFLKRQSILDALLLHRRHPKKIVAMAYGERRGNPCIFPKEYFPELLALTGDHGGRSVLELHESEALYCNVSLEKELIDIDTPETLQRLRP